MHILSTSSSLGDNPTPYDQENLIKYAINLKFDQNWPLFIYWWSKGLLNDRLFIHILLLKHVTQIKCCPASFLSQLVET